MTSGYLETYEQWRSDPQAFWREAAREIAWTRPPERIFDPEGGVYGLWFPDARCNACFNAIDRHVEAGRGDQPAIYYDSPVASTKRTITYRELLDETATLSAVLKDLGVAAGDRVLIYMPMIPEAVVAMLASARIGAVHSVVFGGFAAKELATRIDDAEPKVILTASCGIEPGRIVEYKPLLDLAIALSKHKPASCVVYQRPQISATINPSRDHDWKTLVDAAKAAGKRAPCADLAATDPLYILYTSGTTGVPKGVVRDIGGYIVALKWTMSAIYNVKPGDTYWAASDIGWVVGHSYIVYGPLLHGCASVLYEGKPIGTPDAGAFWRVIQEYKVAAFFTAPTAFRAVRKEDPQAALLKNYDIKSMHTLFLAGERADPDTVAWAEKVLGVPVVDHWWQTETGWAIAANPVGWEFCRSSSVRRPCRCRATTFTSSTRPANPCPPGRWDRSSSSCRCRPAACRPSTGRTSACMRAISRNSRAITKPPTPGSSTRTDIFTSWAAPTTSSTSPAIAFRPAAWRKSSPRIRTSPNARFSASRTRSKASSPAGSWC